MANGFELNPRFFLRGTQVGAYTIESPIDEGGQGVLYRVSRGSNVFTLKMVGGRRAQKPDSDQVETDARLFREFATLLTIDHPNVVKVFSLDWWPELATGRPYFIMEHVEGDPVLRWQQKTHPSLRAICGVILQMARALHALHQHGIIHRDLKSSNLLVREDGVPVIIDFGLVWQRSAWTLTTHANILGTRTHLSPDYCRHFKDHLEDEERYVFQPTDDTHALGYISYEMLAGRPPFDAEEFEQEWNLMVAIGERVPARPRELNPKVPPALDDIVMGLLEKEGERRMNAAKLVAALEKALSEADAEWDVPFDAQSVPAGLPRRTRKGPALAVIGALAVAILAALFVWGAFHWRRAPQPPAAPPAGAPHEPPMPPAAEEGRPTVNDEKKPPAPAPAVAKPSPTAPTRIPKASRCQAMAAAGLVMAGCAHHVFTGTQAGDCSVAPVREVPAPNPEKALDLLKHHSDNPALLPGGAKLRIPPELPVVLDRSNPEGKCKTGNPELIEEPCPVWEGRIVVEVNNYVWDSPGGRTSTPSVLIGETHIIPAKETREEPTVGVAAARPIRDVTGRMTARFTHLRTPDGTMWPVCGELFGWDEKEGVQILAPRYYGKPSTTNWAGVKARFFWAP